MDALEVAIGERLQIAARLGESQMRAQIGGFNGAAAYERPAESSTPTESELVRCSDRVYVVSNQIAFAQDRDNHIVLQDLH